MERNLSAAYSVPNACCGVGGEDPDFCDGSGVPLKIPLRGSRRSFAVLVKRYAGDPRARTLLKELLRVKAVRRLPDRRIEVLSRTFITARWENSGIESVGERVRDLLDTLVHNLKHPSRPRYARFVVNAEVDPRFVPLCFETSPSKRKYWPTRFKTR